MLDLKALNESFDRINSIKTSGKLFEYFCEDCSESGIDKEDILDWLSEHEQLWNDCEKHFAQDPTWLSADELESFICEHEEACKDYAKAFGLSFDEEEELDESCTESFDKFLTEAKISPEDKYDSDIIRSIYAKMRQPGRKQFSDEETAVMKKYGLDFSRDNRGRRDNLVLVNKDGDYLPYYQDYKNNDKVNYADKARKASERHQDSKYKRDNPRWNPENQSVRNPKQTWSRWQDDQEMKSDYRDKYRDLYTKRMFINSNKAQLDLEKDYLSRLQQQVADTENNVKAKQQSYDQQKAEWKKMLADRRAKKNESFDRFLTEAKISPEDKHDSDLIRSIYAKINQKPRRNVEKRLTPEEKAVIDKYNIDLERKYWSGLYGFNTDGEGKLYSITPTVDGVELLEPRTRKHSVDISKANLADKARKTIARDHDNQFYQPIFTYDDGWKYGDRISQTFSKDKKDLENIKKEEPYSDSERKKAIDNFYKDRFGKTPKQEALSEGKVTLFCELENYSRYAFDTHRKVKATGKDHLEALKKLVDNLNLYITSDIIEEEDYTFEDAIESISNTNGDGCDWITKLTDNKGNTFIEEEAYADDWEDLDEGKAFDFNKLNKKLHGNIRL